MTPDSKRPRTPRKTENFRGDTIAEPAATGSEGNAPQDMTEQPAFDATVAFDPTMYRSTKEERDVAMAIVVIQSSQVNTRQIERSLESWTIHGHRSLAEHLVSKGLIDEQERVRLEKLAAGLLAEGDGEVDVQTRLRKRVGPDTWEQICRMLGLITAADAAQVEAPRETLAEYVILRRLGIGGWAASGWPATAR